VCKRKQLKKCLKTDKLDCIPFLFVISSPSDKVTEIELEHPILAKYFQLQLISCIKNPSTVVSDMNLDMYSLSFFGADVEVPSQMNSSSLFPKV
jgi:hypothetical protein